MRAAVAGVLLAWFAAAPAVAADRAVALTASPFPAFRIGHPEETRFGALAFVGGFELGYTDRDVGGLSGLVVDPGGAGLLGLTDGGYMLRARIRRDGAGRPIGFADGMLRRISSVNGGDAAFRGADDTESLDTTIRAGRPIAGVSFEGAPRVMLAPMTADGFVGPLTPIALPADARRVRNTKGFESLAFGPADGPLAGRVLVIAERAPRDSVTDDRPGWILGGDGPVVRFALKAVGDYDATDMKFGPDGRLYVLERLYSLAAGVRARIRRIDPAALVEGAVVDGPAVFEASLADQIDNMEGLSIWTRDDGKTMVSLISDDNRSFLQRTVYLEFELVE